MTIYDLLERLIDGPRLQSYEVAAAMKLVGQMRDMNVFGTTARFLDPATHACQRGGDKWPDSIRCRICQTTMPALPHRCTPYTRYAGGRWDVRGAHVTTCSICGKEM